MGLCTSYPQSILIYGIGLSSAAMARCDGQKISTAKQIQITITPNHASITLAWMMVGVPKTDPV
jgi:hypothetical protein